MFIIICQLYGSLFSNHLPFSNRYGRLIGYYRLMSCRYCEYELLLTARPIFFKISVWYILIRTLCNFCYIIFKNIDSIKYSEGQLLFHNKNNNIGINFSRIIVKKLCKWSFWHPNLPGNLPGKGGGMNCLCNTIRILVHLYIIKHCSYVFHWVKSLRIFFDKQCRTKDA